MNQPKPIRIIAGILLVMWLSIFAAGATSTRFAGINGSTGATDNAILRADGTGGETVQSSGWTIGDAATHIMTAGGNLAMSSKYLSGDGGNEGIFVDGDGNVGLSTTGDPAFPLQLYQSLAGGSVTAAFKNSDNTNAASHIRFMLNTGGDAGGDPFFLFGRDGGNDWYFGMDNSDSDAFVIGEGSTPGASNVIRLSQGGSSTITIKDGYNFVFNATTGTKLGTATTQKLSLWNATPIVQPAANADTSGATLGNLEIEVNELKAILRSIGLMAP